MASDLTGRVTFVTGGESGIGAACAAALSEVGADIAVLFRSDGDAARETVRAVEAHGRRALPVRADVGDEAEVERAFGEAAALGPPDILAIRRGST